MKVRVLLCLALGLLLFSNLVYAAAKDDLSMFTLQDQTWRFWKVYLKNGGERPIKAVVEVITELAQPEYRKIVIEPGESVCLGCTEVSGSTWCTAHKDPVYYRVTGAYYVDGD